MSPVAIVTASDSGIGQECAKELAFVAFLASDKSSFATSSSIIVDGGLTLIGAQMGAS